MDWRELMQRHRTGTSRPTASSTTSTTESPAQPAPPAPPRIEAKSLIRTCLEYGIELRLEPDGCLVVVSHGRAWRALVNEIEAHADEIAALLMEAWEPRDG